jgi:hypothetical protein
MPRLAVLLPLRRERQSPRPRPSWRHPPPPRPGGIADAVAKSLEGSLARLDLDGVDIFHLHNAITETGGGEALSVRQVMDRIASMGTKPWRAMDEYKFLQTICEDGRPADCVPFINGCPSFALQCPESRVLHPLQFVRPRAQFDNNVLFFGLTIRVKSRNLRFGPFLRGLEKKRGESGEIDHGSATILLPD